MFNLAKCSVLRKPAVALTLSAHGLNKKTPRCEFLGVFPLYSAIRLVQAAQADDVLV
jgi:hypothetical protein